MQKEIKTFAPGKILLLGEHAVVYGHPALVAPLTLGVTATLTPGKPRIIADLLGVSFAPDEECKEAKNLDNALRALFTVTGPLPGELRLTGNLPTSRGLGSSAAMAVATAKAIWEFGGYQPSIEELENAAMQSEKVLHHNPSGVDAAASVRNQCFLFWRRTPPQIQLIQPPKKFSLTIVDTGERGPTGELVARIGAMRAADPARIEGMMSELGSLTQNCADHLERGELEEMGAAMDRGFVILRELGLSTPDLDRAAQRAKQAGALGAKLTGAGGGGCLVALSAPEQRGELQKQLRDAGFRVLATEDSFKNF
jgi:mevalonate kinase